MFRCSAPTLVLHLRVLQMLSVLCTFSDPCLFSTKVAGALHLLLSCICMFYKCYRCYAPLDYLLPNTEYLLRNAVKCYWCYAPFLIHVCFLQILPVLCTSLVLCLMFLRMLRCSAPLVRMLPKPLTGYRLQPAI